MKRFLLFAALLLFGGRVEAQDLTAQVTSHTNGQTVYDPNITITWKGCSNQTQTSYTTRVNGTAITTTQSNSSITCPDFQIRKNYSASTTLTRNGNNDIYVSVCDGVHPCGEDSLHVVYAGPEVTVIPDGPTAPTVQKGASGYYIFKVRNTGAHTGNANLSFTCTTGIITCSINPSSASGAISIAPGDSLAVTMSYDAVGPGTAKAVLKATYANFAGVSDTGYVNVPVSVAPTATFNTLTNGQTFFTPSISVAWKGCSIAPQNGHTTKLNDTGINTDSLSTMQCFDDYIYGANYLATATLTPGPNTIAINVCDATPLCGPPTTITVNYAPPAISVTPDGASAPSINKDGPDSYPFTVSNTGGPSATAKFSLSCTTQLSCPSAPDSVVIPAGQSRTVTVSYTGAAGGIGRATLTATYKEYPTVSDNGYVDVSVSHISANFTSHTNGQTVNTPTINLAWKGCSDATQTVDTTRLNGTNVATTQSSTAPCAGFMIGRLYSASVTLQSGSNTLYAKVCDVAACATQTITIIYSTTPTGSVSVTPVQSPKAVSAGTATIQFDVQNTSQGVTDPSTFTLSPAASGSVSSCIQPSSVTLTPGAAATRVDVSCTISNVGTSGSVVLTATTSGPPSFNGSGTTNVTIAPVYRIAISPAIDSVSVSTGSNNYNVVIQNTSSNTSSLITVTLPSPSCSGTTLGSCTIPSNSTTVSQGQQTSVVLSYNALANGTETLTLAPSGTVSGGTVQATNGTLKVKVGSGGQPLTVSLAGKNPGTTIDKAGCLTIAAGQNAAYECGDLRVVHPLPATTTMDRARGPALIYNSRHAKGGALLAADVTWSGAAPTTLKATATIAGQADIVRIFNWNSACASTTCRIVVPISTTQATGLYPVTLQVAALDGTTLLGSGSATDTVVIVNRASSPYGSGWWLDGLESLITLSSAKMLWIGGDGSSRVYTQSGSGSSVYTVTPAFDRPDSLQFVSGSNTWQRQLGDSAYVEFSSDGRHIKTRNALGWVTTFSYANGFLDAITLPVPAGSGQTRAYRFFYTASMLDSVRSPSVSIPRTTKVARGLNWLVDRIVDPDNGQTSFAYDTLNRIVSRTNKMSDPTTFQYDDAGGLKQSSLNMARTNGAGSLITTNFVAAETRSAYANNDTPVLRSKVFTHLQGPRNAGDSTNLIVNRWGAPDSVTNAVGQRMLITRANASFPALATKVVAANGLETRAFFNSRGLTDSTIVVDPYNDTQNARTIYAWNPKWNQVDSIIRPMNERTRMFYRANTPIVDSMRLGIHGRYVRFTYTADNQVRAVAEPLLQPDSVEYDNLGNSTKTWTPVGRAASTPYFTEFVKDSIGRPIVVKSPISGDTIRTSSYTYDAADRVVRTVDYGPPRPYTLPLNASFSPDTAVVQALTRTDSSGYDAEGNLTSRKSFSSSGGVQLNENLKYDAAGRLVRRSVGTGPDSMVYDPAGNLISARHRSGAWVSQSYDVLNRITTRIVPQVTYSKDTNPCSGLSSGPLGTPSTCFMVFPYFPNAGFDFLIPEDTSRFIYDAVGNMTQANNRYARVRRTYYRNGALKTDTMSVGSYTNPPVEGGLTGQLYGYDLSGRRTSMAWGFGSTSYAYDDIGLLASVTAPGGIPFRYTRTMAGRVDSLILGTGVREKRSYDLDGKLISRYRVSDALSPNLLVGDSMSYDKGGQLTDAWEQVRNSTDHARISYDGLGAVVAKEQANQFGSSNVEEFRNDAFGNVVRRLTRKSAGTINTAPFLLSYNIKGELTSWFTQLKTPPESQYQRRDNLSQNFLSGRMTGQSELVQDPNDNQFDYQLASRLYYGSDDRLTAVQRYSVKGSLRDGTWEEYRYDALGRRIMTRVRRSGSQYDGTSQGPICQSSANPSICRSFTEMVWWDGDQALVENRVADGTADVSNNGAVGNVHGLTLDEPLAVYTTYPSIELRIINYNWRGQGLNSVFSDGRGADATIASSTVVDWPAATQAQTYFTPALGMPTDNNPKKWLGTFVQNGQGTTGMLYRRNRYFDTSTGRFTQEDPLGIAGGLNAYGFAEGDPVNFSDPFGLCADPIASGFASLRCALEDAATGAKSSLSSVGSAIANAASYVHLGATGTIGHYTMGGDISGALKISPQHSIVINSPNLAGSVDVGVKGSPPRSAKLTGSLDFGGNSHLGASANIYLDSTWKPVPYGVTVHFGTTPLVLPSPIGITIDLPANRKPNENKR